MPEEINFSGGVRGQFYRPGIVLNVPVYLDAEVHAYLSAIASRKGVGLSELANDQVELDVIIRNGMLIICELKSSIDKAGMYIFERKARFYEKRHERTANRLIVISPMIDARARKVAKALGIETFGDSLDVKTL